MSSLRVSERMQPAKGRDQCADNLGYDKRRIVTEGVCVSDLAVFGSRKLFEKGLLKPEEIDDRGKIFVATANQLPQLRGRHRAAADQHDGPTGQVEEQR